MQMNRKKASADAPIGVFDSGVGGLSIANDILKHLPHEHIKYLADTAHVPYGAREDDDIRHLTAQAVDWLYQQGCKAVVVACNTASAFSLDYLREYYGSDFPIIGLVPALKPAVLNTKNKVVAVLATPATFRGKLIKDVMLRFAEPLGVSVLPITSLELVPLVEAGQQNSPKMHRLLTEILQPAVDKKADQLVLGCTHYPFLKASIEYVFPRQFELVDSGQAVARQLSHVLSYYQLINEVVPVTKSPQMTCYFTGEYTLQMRKVLEILISKEVTWKLSNL
ncbi:glutamate racemase [Acinetobacter nectaris]|uniref:glutamate racemase n=1 Tax=Acinetobacter nectaris TaxID=1219382 RepID=UPI001EFFAEFC|nr:glutamate racemase [Acinetobacter nectaris]MCF9033467.1 glutamate racemase [Acinetobacter nectaris]